MALESSLITHGLPQPINLEVARELEAEVASKGSQPATIALLRGKVRLGLTADELRYLATTESVAKISRRDLAAGVTLGMPGGTTVSATMIVAHAAGVRVFATGGIGGVHRGSSGDVSADLAELAKTPVAVVCSGAKAILDLPRTLEWLETAGVPIIGFQTSDFPAFYSRESGLPVSVSASTISEAAEVVRAHWSMGLASGLLVAVPCPEEAALDREMVEAALERAEAEARKEGVSGGALTPYILGRLADLTQGATLQANRSLLRRNAGVAGALAAALRMD